MNKSLMIFPVAALLSLHFASNGMQQPTQLSIPDDKNTSKIITEYNNDFDDFFIKTMTNDFDQPEINEMGERAALRFVTSDVSNEQKLFQAVDNDHPDTLGWRVQFAPIEPTSIDRIDYLLAMHTDPNIQNLIGQTPLHKGIIKKNIKIVRKLLEHGRHLSYCAPITVNTTDNNGKTPLMSAIEDNNIDAAALLIAHGADIPPYNGSNELIKRMLAQGKAIDQAIHNKDTMYNIILPSIRQALIVNKNNQDALRPFLALSYRLSKTEYFTQFFWQNDIKLLLQKYAHAFGIFTTIKMIVDEGNQVMRTIADETKSISDLEIFFQKPRFVNVTDANGNTPLHKATYMEDTARVKILLEHGADINIRNTAHLSPLHCAVKQGNKEIVMLFLAPGVQPDLHEHILLFAAQKNQTDIALLLMQKSLGDANTYDSQHNSALHFAANNNNKILVEALINYKHDINAQNSSGDTPLTIAMSLGHTLCAQYLIANGADISLQNKKGRNALHYAASNGNLNLVQTINKKGYFLTTPDGNGLLPLDFAIYNNHLSTVKYFIESLKMTGYNPYVPLPSSLHHAAATGKVDIVRYFLERNIPVEAPIKQRADLPSPFTSAAKNNHINTLPLLFAHGANLCEPTDYMSEATRTILQNYKTFDAQCNSQSGRLLYQNFALFLQHFKITAEEALPYIYRSYFTSPPLFDAWYLQREEFINDHRHEYAFSNYLAQYLYTKSTQVIPQKALNIQTANNFKK